MVVDAAVKIAAHDTIVAGFDAVAPSEVRKARRGVAMSAATSKPARTLTAAIEAAIAEPDEHCGSEQAEHHPQRIEGQHRRRAGGTESGIKTRR